MLELEIKQLRAQQVEGKTTQGPHPFQQTLKSLMTALGKAKLTLEKVEKLYQVDGAKPEEGTVVEGALEEPMPQLPTKRMRVD